MGHPIFKPDKSNLEELYKLGHTQKEVAEIMGFTQKVIWRAMRDYKIVSRPAIPRNQMGSKNASWKGGRRNHSEGYLYIQCKGHPRAKYGGYVLAHILVMEQKLGRFLIWKGPKHPETEIVHHKNEKKSDNRVDNLELTTFSKHASHHNKLRKK